MRYSACSYGWSPMYFLSVIAALLSLALLIGVPVLAVMMFSVGGRLRRLEATNAAIKTRLEGLEKDLANGPLRPDTAAPSVLQAPPQPEVEQPKPDEGLPEAQPDAEPERSSAVPRVPIAGASVPDAEGQLPAGLAGGPPAESLERRLGTRWAVYIGGAALALGGVFLVKHAIDAGLLTPAMRVVLGFVLGLGLVGAGTRMTLAERARGSAGGTGATATGAGAHIPSVLTAAGTIVLFGSAYAAYALYGLIGAGFAFTLLGAIGIATMLSAAIHGPALAGLGLAGSYVTPLLISSDAPSPWPLIIYLAVVALAALVLARLRGWAWLLSASVAGAVVWGLVMLSQGLLGERVETDVWYFAAMVHTALQTALAGAVLGIAALPSSASSAASGQTDTAEAGDWLAVGALAALSLLAVCVLLLVPLPAQFALWQGFAVVMVGLLLGVGIWSVPLAASGVLAGLVALGCLSFWPGVEAVPPASVRWPGVPDLMRLPDVINQFAVFAFGACGAIAGGALWRLMRHEGRAVEANASYAIAATVVPLLVLTVAYLRITQFGTSISFTGLGVGLALAYAWLAQVFERREAGLEGSSATAARIATAAMAAAAIAALSLALVAGMQRGYLTVAFALAAVGTAYVASRKDIAILRPAAGVLGLVVLGRILWDPRIMGADLGTMPVLNWLLIGYGVPAVAFWVAGDLLRRGADDWASRLMEGLAVLFSALLVFWQIRHWLNDGDPLAATSGHVEAGLMALMGLGFTHVMQRLGAHWGSLVLRYASYAFAILSCLIVVLGLGLAHNPLFHLSERVGGGVPLSTLVPAYLLPGLMALYLARHGRGGWPAEVIIAVAVAALVLIFGYVTLEVRHAFQGEILALRQSTGNPEIWAYTVAWLLLAIAFLTYGLVRGSLPARAASGLLLALTVGKVALVDLAGIEGVWRALSFLCLGAVLIGIGLVYQRLVFVGPADGGDMTGRS